MAMESDIAPEIEAARTRLKTARGEAGKAIGSELERAAPVTEKITIKDVVDNIVAQREARLGRPMNAAARSRLTSEVRGTVKKVWGPFMAGTATGREVVFDVAEANAAKRAFAATPRSASGRAAREVGKRPPPEIADEIEVAFRDLVEQRLPSIVPLNRTYQQVAGELQDVSRFAKRTRSDTVRQLQQLMNERRAATAATTPGDATMLGFSGLPPGMEFRMPRTARIIELLGQFGGGRAARAGIPQVPRLGSLELMRLTGGFGADQPGLTPPEVPGTFPYADLPPDDSQEVMR
jgi:hypothetical protein